jgi:hypothetical protein
MRLATISPQNQQRLAVLAPLVALFLSLFVVYPAWGRYNDLRAENEKKGRELEALRAIPIPEPGPVRPAADDLPSELPQFLGHISALAAVANCRIVGFESLPAAGKEEAATGGVRARQAKVELEDPYPRVRDFLAQLARADRLFVVAGVELSRGKGQAEALHTTITIERYVAPRAGTTASPSR